MENYNIDNEVWKDVKDFEGLYKVSSHGRVYSVKRSLYRKTKTNNRDYWQIALFKNGEEHMFLVHRLVALHFVDNDNSYPQVNHKDEDKDNNYAGNLEWCTNEYNALYGTRVERTTNNEQYQASRKAMRVRVRGTCVEGMATIEINGIVEGVKFGFSSSGIGGCLRGVNKTHKGFTWEYI